MEGTRETGATVGDIVDAVIMYDDPILDHRFTRVITKHPDPQVRADLLSIPERIIAGARATREAQIAWDQAAHPAIVEAFVSKAERFLLESFLDSAEGQIRLKSFLSRHAPVAEVRNHIEDAIAYHREVTDILRRSLGAMASAEAGDGAPSGRSNEPAYVGAEDPSGDLRGQVERAIRCMRSEGHEPRTVVLSHVALRHLRDQGCFRDRDPTILGVAVEIDLSWDAPHFAIHSYDTVSLDEIFRSRDEP